MTEQKKEAGSFAGTAAVITNATLEAKRKELMEACKEYDLGKVKELVADGLDVNFRQVFDTPLTFVCDCLPQGSDQARAAPLALHLIQHCGADVSLTDGLGRSPLHHAAASASVEVVRELLERGASVNAEDDNENTPLLDACRFNWCEQREAIIQLLLEHRADPELANFNGDYPLFFAVGRGESERDARVVKLLLSAGARTDIRNKDGQTPLLYACSVSSESEEVALALLEHGGVDVNATDGYDYSAIHYACERGLEKVFFRLVELECSTEDKVERKNRNCLQLMAASQGKSSSAIFAYLVNHAFHGHLDETDELGDTALQIACSHANFEYARMLILAGADVDAGWHGDNVWSLPPPFTLIRDRLQELAAQDCLATLIKYGWQSVHHDPEDPEYAERVESWRRAAIADLLVELVGPPGTGMKPYRRLLNGLLRTSLLDDAILEGGRDLIGAATASEQAARMREDKLRLIKDEAWERRRHLCLDRALWRKPVPSEPKKPKDADKPRSTANAGAGKATE
jgi:ankyrin repeat protein